MTTATTTNTTARKKDTSFAYANGDLSQKKDYAKLLNEFDAHVMAAVAIADKMGISDRVSINSTRGDGSTFEVPEFQLNVPIALEKDGTTIAANIFFWGWDSVISKIGRICMDLHEKNRNAKGYDNRYLVGLTMKPRRVNKSAVSV